MQRGAVYEARSLSTQHFLAPLAQNGFQAESIEIPSAVSGGITARSYIRQVAVFSVQQLAWEVWIFRRGSFDLVTVDLLSPLVRVRWAAADGLTIGNGTLFNFLSAELEIPYEDMDGHGKLHLLLQNRSPTAKLAGAAGAVVIRCLMEPAYAI